MKIHFRDSEMFKNILNFFGFSRIFWNFGSFLEQLPEILWTFRDSWTKGTHKGIRTSYFWNSRLLGFSRIFSRLWRTFCWIIQDIFEFRGILRICSGLVDLLRVVFSRLQKCLREFSISKNIVQIRQLWRIFLRYVDFKKV